ncbi:hypothetical protein CTI12_AA203370 [Artemisia annua]|uniref:F-box domain, Leucine-rich repeat domain, L domain-like protein n=1 Tax=Artemisia annua TaxID=35608 RepID=A0A2U1NBB9_ARTAN|nr:hypothetical protein CTI12_AA203370 [Artemisia annua]
MVICGKFESMPMLTSLTLESVRLDDKRLVRLNKCFPNLKFLNLIGVSGLKAPCIHLLNLKTCHWTVPDSLFSLTLITPNLSTLSLECIKSTRLHVEAPKLFHIHLDIERRNFEIKKFENLKTVWLKSRNIGALFETFELAETVKNLTLDTRDWPRGATGSSNFMVKRVFNVFPNVSSLCIKSNVWLGFEACYRPLYWETWDVRQALKTFSAYLLLVYPSVTISCVSDVLDGCMGVSEVSLLIHGDVDSTVSKSFISRCMTQCRPGLNWRWGIWREGMEDSWITDFGGLSD